MARKVAILVFFLLVAMLGVLAYHGPSDKPGPAEKYWMKNISEEKWRWEMPEKEIEKYIEIYKEIKTKTGEREVEVIIEIEDGLVKMTKEVEIEVNNKTIEIRHERLLNETYMIINKEIKVEIEGEVIVDKSKKKIILIKNNKTVEIDEYEFEHIERSLNETKKRLMQMLQQKIRNVNMLREMLQEKVQYEVEVANNQTIVVKAKVPVKARIFWILPVSFEIIVEREIDTQTGTIIETERMPWWARLLWALIVIES